jgi:hypothetical protein
MRVCRLISAAALIALVALTACQQQPKTQPKQDDTARADAPPRTSDSLSLNDVPATHTPSLQPPAAPDAIAHHVESYARNMESVLQKRQPGRAAPTEPSGVHWLDPTEFRLIQHPQPSQSPVAGAPAVPQGEQASPGAPVQSMAQREGTTQGVSSTRVPPTEVSQTQSNSPAILVEPASPAADTPAVQAAAVSAGDLQQKLSRRVSDYPRDVCGHLEFQLLQFLLEEPVPHLSTLTSLPAEDRELVTAVLDALSNFRHTLRSDNNMLLSRKMRPLVDLADRLRTQAELTIPTLTLCSRVDGFGVFTPMEPRFIAGRPAETIIYCELENFAAHQNESNQWQVNLTKNVVIYSETGMQVWEDKADQVHDVARSRRRDFFLRKRIALPATLPIGRYLLKVSIVDEQANRVAESSLPIVIVAQ